MLLPLDLSQAELQCSNFNLKSGCCKTPETDDRIASAIQMESSSSQASTQMTRWPLELVQGVGFVLVFCFLLVFFGWLWGFFSWKLKVLG